MRTYDTSLRLLLLATVILLTGVVAASGQMRGRVDNRGKEFRLAFLHTNGYDEYPRLSIIVASEKTTRGTITYMHNPSEVVNIVIPANVAQRIDLDTFNLLLPNPRSVPISDYTVLVRFDEEVVLYGMNTQRWSSDGFLSLPKEVCGTEYIVLSYPNTISPDPTSAIYQGSDFPSQFAVIATEDGTVLNVDPTVRLTSRDDDAPFNVTLKEGEIYFAQAFGKAGRDLTGSTIRSNKPIIVYGSHQRANIPWDDAVGRDHLIEQLPPVDRWGNEAILLPHFQLPKTVNDANIARIIASRNNTVLNIDSATSRTLQAGEMIEIPLDRALVLTANEPFLAAQYQHSTVDEKYMSQPNDSVGDPFMTLVIPRVQFDSVHWFESVATKDFFYHYINVVIPTERVNTLRLDGAQLDGPQIVTPFSRIDKSSYSWATIRVYPGYHKISARVPFGLYAYGYGPYNSYGYPGAMVFDTLFKDQKQPDISWRDSCGGAIGDAFDDSTFDFGMESLRLGPASRNVALETDPFTPGVDSIHFRLRLDDPYQDGFAEMIAVDTAGLDRYYRFPVKGFTVAMDVGQVTPVPLDTLASLNGQEFCANVTVRNYGGFPQRIERLRLSSNAPGLRVGGSFPIDIPPGGSHDFQICFQRTGDTSFTFEVAIDNGCQIRTLAYLPVISGIDSLVPIINPVFEPCQTDRTINISELGALNSGVKEVIFNVLRNAQQTVTPLPSKSATVQLHRIDPFQDMIYSMTIIDAVGNTATIADTVGGFTLSVQKPNRDQVGVRVNRPWEYNELTYGEETCDTFYLENYGLLPLELQRPRILGNIEYSIPPDQLPILLQPNERRPLVICLRPVVFGDRLDTLVIDFYCGNPTELVQLQAFVNPLDGIGGDRCGNQIHFEVGGAVKRNFLQAPTPNPARGDGATITFGLEEQQRVTLAVYNALGNEVQRMLDNDEMPAGIISIDARLEDLPSGIYYLRIVTSTGDVMSEKLNIAR